MLSRFPKAFELTWMVGFFWCFLLKYPQSIYSLFLRRSLPMDATHIAVTAPVKRIDTLYKEKCIANCFGAIKRSICRVLNFIFSLESNQTNFECKTTYCEVISGEVAGKEVCFFVLHKNLYCFLLFCFILNRSKNCNTLLLLQNEALCLW